MNRDRFLSINPLKCTGCKECETACSKKHEGKKRTAKPRIQVLGGSSDSRDFHFPVTCQQCTNPPCMAACPKDAIHRDPESGRVLLDDNACVGCRMCVSACPTGAVGFDADLGIAYKCDLCGGDPQCARVCQPRAIEYELAEMLHHAQMVHSASKLYQVVRNQVPLPGI